MGHSNIIRRIFEHVSDIIGLNSLETRMKVLGSNCYSFTKRTVLAQTVRFIHNSPYFKNVFLTMLTAVWSIKVFLIPWYTHPVLKKHIVT